MRKTLTMCDVSHWQDKSYDKHISDYDIMAHKITEGLTFVDSECERRVKLFSQNKPTILYHVVTRDNVAKQCLHFCEMYERMNNLGLGMALDFENAANYYPYNTSDLVIGAIEEFHLIIKDRYRKRLIVYLGDLYNDGVYNAIRTLDLGLWIPRYEKFPTHSPDIWQYKAGDSGHLDSNTFYGDEEKLKTFLL